MSRLSSFLLTFLCIWTAQISKTVEGLDECAVNLNSCPAENTVCKDLDFGVSGTTTCICPSGFTGNQTHCYDINECKSGNPCLPTDKYVRCENTIGSYLCLCVRNYKKASSGLCVDIDECADATHQCHKHAVCTNVIGGYNCTCKSGFSGDGKSCSDINECLNNNGGCHGNASCDNLAGSYACSCRVKVETSKSCQVSSYCPTTEKDDDDDLVVILVAIVIALLACCLIALIIAIMCVYRLKSKN